MNQMPATPDKTDKILNGDIQDEVVTTSNGISNLNLEF